MKQTKQAQAEKTYTVNETTHDFMTDEELNELYDEPYANITDMEDFRVEKEFEVKEGEPWYGACIFNNVYILKEDIENIENIDELEDEELEQIIHNMSDEEITNLMKNGIEEDIETLYDDCDYRGYFTKVDENYKAHAIYSFIDISESTISFQAEIKFKFWIENGEIKHEPVWEFKN